MAIPLIAPLTAALMKGFKIGATGLGVLGGTPVGTARLGGSALNLLKQAYTPNGMGLVNLGMDAIPLITDIANNDVGLKSFSSFGGTMIGTKFGGRELNRVGQARLQNSRDTYNTLAASQPRSIRKEYVNERIASREKDLLANPQTSRQGYNMAAGMGADVGLYSLTSGMNQPKNSPEVESLLKQQEMANSPVTRYMQMTGGL